MSDDASPTTALAAVKDERGRLVKRDDALDAAQAAALLKSLERRQ